MCELISKMDGKRALKVAIRTWFSIFELSVWNEYTKMKRKCGFMFGQRNFAIKAHEAKKQKQPTPNQETREK